jgi:uncharacterized protein (DUF736 family)
MSIYEVKPNTGSLFANDKKREGKQDADYRGSALVGGVEYWLDAWVNTAQSTGKKYLAIKLKAKDAQAPAPIAAAKPAPAAAEDFNDDIPF